MASAAGPDRDGHGGGHVSAMFLDRFSEVDRERAVVPVDARGGNEVLAVADELGAPYVAFLHGPEPDPDLLAESVGRLDRFATVALDVVDAPGMPEHTARLRRIPSVPAIARRLGRGRARSLQDGPAIVVDVDAALEVGGFDPSFPGLGWPDLIARLLRADRAVAGLSTLALPFVDALYPGLDPPDRIRSEARWLQLHDDGAWPRRDRLTRYRARVLAATTGRSGRGRTGGLRAEVRTEARRWWRGPAPHESQVGVGNRADWRFVLPTAGWGHAVLVPGGDPLGSAGPWDWLVDDGWAQRLTVMSDPSPDVAADVVIVAPGCPLGPAAAAVGPGGSVCVLVAGRAGADRRRAAGATTAAELFDLGFDGIRRYLVLPDLRRPTRFVPLDHPGGLDWLLTAAPPATAGRLSARNRRRRRAARAGRAGFARLLGDAVVVARRPDEARPPFTIAGVARDRLGPGTTDAIVLTSGFDEGSRAVVVPLALETGPGADVIKVSARPRYNANVDRERSALGSLPSALHEIGLVPRPGAPFDAGPLRAASEEYAGRWTAAGVLDEQDRLADQAHVLDVVSGAITQLGRETVQATERWSTASFETHVGRWLDRLAARSDAPSPLLSALRTDLHERSDRLAGLEVPLVARHYDLGPWNVVFRDEVTNRGPGGSPVAIVDWETAPPRIAGEPGLAGADLLYFAKYWLHPVMGTRSVADELSAFPFLLDALGTDDPRWTARQSLLAALDAFDLPGAFVPILATHVWSEAACYTMERRKEHGGDPGSPGAYVLALARHRRQLLAAWPR